MIVTLLSSQERKYGRQCPYLCAPVQSKVRGNDSGLVHVLKVPTTNEWGIWVWHPYAKPQKLSLAVSM